MNNTDTILQYIVDKFPMYEGYRLRSLHWEYDLSALTSEIVNVANEAFAKHLEVIPEDFNHLIERVEPPEGFTYITIQKGKKRVGINVPTHVFQK